MPSESPFREPYCATQLASLVNPPRESHLARALRHPARLAWRRGPRRTMHLGGSTSDRWSSWWRLAADAGSTAGAGVCQLSTLDAHPSYTRTGGPVAHFPQRERRGVLHWRRTNRRPDGAPTPWGWSAGSSRVTRAAYRATLPPCLAASARGSAAARTASRSSVRQPNNGVRPPPPAPLLTRGQQLNTGKWRDYASSEITKKASGAQLPLAVGLAASRAGPI